MDPPSVLSRAAAGCINTCLLVLSVSFFWAGAGDWVASCDTSSCVNTTSTFFNEVVHDAIIYELETNFEASLLLIFLLVAILFCCVGNVLSTLFNLGSYTICSTCHAARLVLSNPFPVGSITFALVVLVQWIFLMNRSNSYSSVHLNCTVNCAAPKPSEDGEHMSIAALVLSTCALLFNLLGIWFCTTPSDSY